MKADYCMRIQSLKVDTIAKIKMRHAVLPNAVIENSQSDR